MFNMATYAPMQDLKSWYEFYNAPKDLLLHGKIEINA